MISCLCPTFGRVALLEEAIESYLRQDYPGKSELVICNDQSEQRLHFDHPSVRIINLKQRCTDLGTKRNTTASYARGDWLLTWGDDDIHLPGRIRRMADFVQSNGFSFALEGPHFILNHTGMHRKTYATAGAHLIHRNFLKKIGGLSHQSHGEDVDLNQRIQQAIGPLPTCEEEPQFIYRWHSDRPHISALQSDHYRIIGELSSQMLNEGKEPTGDIDLQPCWRQDWMKLAEMAQM